MFRALYNDKDGSSVSLGKPTTDSLPVSVHLIPHIRAGQAYERSFSCSSGVNALKSSAKAGLEPAAWKN